MNLALSDEQEFLREAARGTLSRFKTLEAAREALDGDEQALPDLWPTAREAGWPGLLIDEAAGGAGLDAFEAMGLLGADYFVSAIGPAFEVFAQYSKIVKLSGEEVEVSDLMVLARQAVAHHAMRRLLGPESLEIFNAGSYRAGGDRSVVLCRGHEVSRWRWADRG